MNGQWIRWIVTHERHGSLRRGGWLCQLQYLPGDWNFCLPGLRVGGVCCGIFARLGPFWFDAGYWFGTRRCADYEASVQPESLLLRPSAPARQR